MFTRHQEGSRPTELGQQLLARARPLVSEMTALTAEMRSAAARVAQAPRIGSIISGALSGWISRLHRRYPSARPSVQTEVSPNVLLRMLATGQLDIAFVYEAEGAPLRFPPGVRQRVLVEREPLCLTLPEHHPLASRTTVRLEDLGDEQWVLNSAADEEWESVCRALHAAGLSPRLSHGDYLTSNLLGSAGHAVTVAQATASGGDGRVVRQVEGEPLVQRWLLVARGAADLDAVYEDLVAAYRETAEKAPAYPAATLLTIGLTPPVSSAAPAATLSGSAPSSRSAESLTR